MSTQTQTSPPKYKFDKSFTFRLRQHSGKPFGDPLKLWQVCLLNKVGGIEKEIVDANDLESCFDLMRQELEDAGF